MADMLMTTLGGKCMTIEEEPELQTKLVKINKKIKDKNKKSDQQI